MTNESVEMEFSSTRGDRHLAQPLYPGIAEVTTVQTEKIYSKENTETKTLISLHSIFTCGQEDM